MAAKAVIKRVLDTVGGIALVLMLGYILIRLCYLIITDVAAARVPNQSAVHLLPASSDGG